MLGAGTAIPAPNRSQASLLVRLEGADFLFDIGPGTVNRLAAHGIDPFNLQHIYLTHLHPDHTLDLATLLQNLVSTPERIRTEPLFLTGCRGTLDFFAWMMRLYPDIIPDGYRFQLRELDETRIELEGATITTTYSGHTSVSLSYRLDAPDGSLVYTGDCAPSASLTEFCAEADLLVCECSFPSGWPTDDHMDADALGRLAAEAGVKHLVATHLYPPALNADIPAQIRKHYPGPVSIALDGACFSLPERGAR